MDPMLNAYLKKMSKRRVELYMSIRTLSLLSGISQSTIRRYERGNVNTISTNRLIMLMKSLGVPHIDFPKFEREFEANNKSIQED